MHRSPVVCRARRQYALGKASRITARDMAAASSVALVLGVGPGVGTALCKVFADRGMRVAAASRAGAPAAAAIPGVKCYTLDASDPDSVESVVAAAEVDLGPITVAVYNAGPPYNRKSVLELSPKDLEAAFKIGCLGGFAMGQAVAKRMLPRGSGTILFTGATASTRGGAQFSVLSVPKFGLRSVAQSMARELGPKGIHVAHILVDGVVDLETTTQWMGPASQPDARISPDALAQIYLSLHEQQRSAWSFEVDARPYCESF